MLTGLSPETAVPHHRHRRAHKGGPENGSKHTPGRDSTVPVRTLHPFSADTVHGVEYLPQTHELWGKDIPEMDDGTEGGIGEGRSRA